MSSAETKTSKAQFIHSLLSRRLNLVMLQPVQNGHAHHRPLDLSPFSEYCVGLLFAKPVGDGSFGDEVELVEGAEVSRILRERVVSLDFLHRKQKL